MPLASIASPNSPCVLEQRRVPNVLPRSKCRPSARGVQNGVQGNESVHDGSAEEESANEGSAAMKLANKVAIITGAAQGIGAACARAFAQAGAKVVASDVNEVGCAALAKDIAAAGGYAVSRRADVGSKSEADSLIRSAVEQFGRLDVLVNNAGIVHAAEFLDLAEEDFDRVLRVNLKGAFLCAQAAARQMVAQAPR